MPCKHEGGADPCPRRPSGACSVMRKQYTDKNKEQIKILQRKYYMENRPRLRKQGNKKSAEYQDSYMERVVGVPSTAIGAAGEFIVGADLLLRGFGVTRPLDVGALHDLHVELPSVGWVGVQVKVVKVNRKTGTWQFSNASAPRRSPVYALVRPSTKEVRYEAGSEPLPVELT